MRASEASSAYIPDAPPVPLSGNILCVPVALPLHVGAVVERSSPGIRPAAQYFCTRRSDIPHFSANCRTVMYSIPVPPVTSSHKPVRRSVHFPVIAEGFPTSFRIVFGPAYTFIILASIRFDKLGKIVQNFPPFFSTFSVAFGYLYHIFYLLFTRKKRTVPPLF